jgi:hypothetical protein
MSAQPSWRTWALDSRAHLTLSRARFAVCRALCLATLLSACHSAPGGGAATPAVPTSNATQEAGKSGAEATKDGDEAQEEGVTLKPEEVHSLGVEVTPARGMTHAAEVAGFGLVTTHEVIAQAVTELVTAAATERQSRAALERAQRLAGTPGAMAADILESARRQATVDAAATLLARRKLTASFGQKAPWGDRPESPVLEGLANGELKLVRVTFPLGSLDASQSPATLRLSRLDDLNSGAGWTTRDVWSAPADSSIPGSSFFALLRGTSAREGERLVAFAPVGAPLPGSWVPASAIVISDGKYWCYVETGPNVFVRRALDTSLPLERGYFVREGIAPGENVVTAAAGLLLARETNPATGAD